MFIVFLFCISLHLLIGSRSQYEHVIKRSIFVYDWGPDIDPFPNNSSWRQWESYKMNGGAGTVINESIGLYDTFSYSLHRIAMARIMRMPLRTTDPTNASLFFIPYDQGVDAMIIKETGKYRLDDKNIGNCGLARKAIELMKKQPSSVFKNHLHDHVVIFSIGHTHPLKSSCIEFFKFCWNCTFLTTNTYEGYHNKTAYTAKPWLSIPYASSWHHSEPTTIPPWNSSSSDRPFLVTFLGSISTLNQHSNRLRSKFIRQCNRTKLGVNRLGKPKAYCNIIVPEKGNRHKQGMEDVSVYRKSVFCLCPPGDNPVRKGIFDALNAGCIPVFLHEESFNKQYYLHLTLAQKRAISLTFDGHRFLKTKTWNLVSELKKIASNRTKITEMQRALTEIGATLQYSIPPPITNNLSSSAESSVWSPPFTDAADILVRRLLDLESNL